MLTKRGTRVALGLLIALIGVGLAGAPALAGDGWGRVDCDATPHASGCQVGVGTPGTPVDADGAGQETTGSGSGRAGGDAPCRYERLTEQAPSPPGAGQGAWYQRVCLQDNGVSTSPAVWLEQGQAGAEALAREAVSRLRLPSPVIRRNPASAAVLVQVPVWLWVDPAAWGPRRATASVPGLSVTATATPTRVVWSPGDGSAGVVCQGRGTPWRPGMDPGAASSCGHTYRMSSAGAPGHVFRLRATVTWAVSWSGGGRSGTVAPLTTTSSVLVPVAQSQAIVAGQR
ncbi:hypothetical protein [Plantactinospora sp. CA-290183]|uniref:hypothetical protein n=1 Tax=Plantactinospora sp. CA-290183 TaxID=3240006 RepID=UPI003D90E26A